MTKLEEKEYRYGKLQGLIIKTYDKETPKTHNYGKLLNFYCDKCKKWILSVYETDHLRGGGVHTDVRYCSRCGNKIDFGEYYHKDKSLDEDLKLQD